MNQQRISTIYIIVIFFALLGGVFVFAMVRNAIQSRMNPESLNASPSPMPELSALTVGAGKLTAQGKLLDRVEIGYIPEGKEIADDTFVPIGDATKSGPDMLQIWTLPVPEQPFLATNVYAKGFDKNGNVAGIRFLGIQGSEVIKNALWPENDAAQELSLRIGEEKMVNGLAVKLIKITEDSRCPQGVQCIWAGRVGAEIELKANNTVEKVILFNDRKEAVFEGYSIVLVEAEPAPREGKEIAGKDYIVTFTIKK